MITIIRWTFGNTTYSVTALAQRSTGCIMIHIDIRPAWITVTGFTTDQAGMIGGRRLIRRMTARRTTTRRDSTVINTGPDKGYCRMTGATVLSTYIGVNLIKRRNHRGDSTGHMTTLARGCTRGSVVHRHTRPAWITVTGLTTD